MPPNGLDAVELNRSCSKHKKKPVRRDAEKRRRQNIEAQKRYREKQRERLQNLEAIAASAGQIRGRPKSSPGIDQSRDCTQICNSSSIDHGTSGFQTEHQAPSNEYRTLSPQSGDSPLTQNTWDSHSSSSSSTTVPDDLGHLNPQARSDSSFFDSFSYSSPPSSDRGGWQLLTPPSENSQSESRSPAWDSCTHVSSSFLIRDKNMQASGPYWTTTVDCGCPTPHVQLRSREPSTNVDTEIVSFGNNGAIDNSYLENGIRLERVCIASALYTLMKYVGIGDQHFCADESPSPFFRASIEFADDSTRTRTVGLIQQTFKSLKPDLRPIAEQIAVEHHPYIDILPFPTLRRNLIIHQKELDEDEFLNDTLTGLVCWGGVSSTEKDSDNVTGHKASGTPWDMRNWEAKVWFLKKYWRLLGGEEGELVKQSEWWRSVRGEDAKIDPD